MRKCAEEINSLVGDKIDVLINNAGIMATDTFATAADGVESQFGANHVGPLLLTNLLVERMGEGTSMGYEICGVRFDDWNFQVGVLWFVWLLLYRLRGKGREGKGRKKGINERMDLELTPATYHKTEKPTTHGTATGSPKPPTSSSPNP